MTPRRTIIIDSLLLFAVTVLAVIAAWGLIAANEHRWLLISSIVGLALAALGSVIMRFIMRPDHLKALQSHLMLEIADQSLAYFRKGLTAGSAQEVCKIALYHSDAAAVAITDTERILGFAGLGEDHHEVGGPILTRATREALVDNEHRILATRDEIGCPDRKCLLRAAIVVPLEVRGTPCGTLKFYYTTPRLLNETQIALAEGLAKLLSTQLELSELDRQTELAYRMELKALQAQINPHFLFNTINTIASLIRTDPPQARELLREFAWFYRRTLEENVDLVPLTREIEYVVTYLRFEKARFGDRIQFFEDVSPQAHGTLVPPFVIQPVVENCIQHAMGAEGPLRIELKAWREGARLVVSVTDDGVGIPPARLPDVLEPGIGTGMGIALSNVNDRLGGHFGPGSGVEVRSTPGKGTEVRLTIARAEENTGGDHDA